MDSFGIPKVLYCFISGHNSGGFYADLDEARYVYADVDLESDGVDMIKRDMSQFGITTGIFSTPCEAMNCANEIGSRLGCGVVWVDWGNTPYDDLEGAGE